MNKIKITLKYKDKIPKLWLLVILLLRKEKPDFAFGMWDY